MTLKDDIQDRLVADTESILQANMDAVEDLFKFHSDGTIDIKQPYREMAPQPRLLIYLIAQRYAYEGDLADEPTLDSSYFYERLEIAERTIREQLQELRDTGLVAKEGQSTHRLVVENLPTALNQIQSDSE